MCKCNKIYSSKKSINYMALINIYIRNIMVKIKAFIIFLL